MALNRIAGVRLVREVVPPVDVQTNPPPSGIGVWRFDKAVAPPATSGRYGFTNESPIIRASSLYFTVYATDSLAVPTGFTGRGSGNAAMAQYPVDPESIPIGARVYSANGEYDIGGDVVSVEAFTWTDLSAFSGQVLRVTTDAPVGPEFLASLRTPTSYVAYPLLILALSDEFTEVWVEEVQLSYADQIALSGEALVGAPVKTLTRVFRIRADAGISVFSQFRIDNEVYQVDNFQPDEFPGHTRIVVSRDVRIGTS